MSKRLYCAWCGEDLGERPAGWSSRDIESCGKPECNRQVRAMEREREDQAREEADRDGYSRYGGRGW